MEKLTSITWLGRVIALQGLLELVSKISLSMQKVNVVPWELMAERREFYDKLTGMQAALRKQPHKSDPRWSSTPLDPILAKVFPFLHGEPDPKHQPSVTRLQMLMSGTYKGQEVKVPEEDRIACITSFEKAAFDLIYDVAN